MKKFAAGLIVAGIALLGITPTAQATNNGGSAVVTVEVLLNGDVEVTSTKDLSNVHIAVCVEGEVRVVKFDSLDNKVEVFDIEGNLIAVLAHSGNNTTAEAEALLELLGGNVNGNSTGVIAYFDEEALEDCKPEEPTTTTTTAPPTTTTTEPPVVTTTTQPSVTTTTTGPSVVTTTPVVETPVNPVPEVPVTNVSTDDELAFGGSWAQVTAVIGALVGLTGLALLLLSAILRRRA